jgi:hypothetical protein
MEDGSAPTATTHVGTAEASRVSAPHVDRTRRPKIVKFEVPGSAALGHTTPS